MGERAEAGGDSAGKAWLFYEQLKADVLAGRLAPGQRLSEASLSREYGMSRSPIREATIRLEHDGLIERQGMIVRVRERTFDEIIDIYRVRVHLEGAIAADAATRSQELDLVRLQSAVDAESRVRTADPQEVVGANRAFHDALAAAAHNVTLADLQQRLTEQVATMPSTTLNSPGRWGEAHEEHEQICQAVRDRDQSAARSLAEQHMGRARDIRLALYGQEQASR